MQLLIQRGQRKTLLLRRPLFKLWVKFECLPEEAALINKYQVYNMILTEGGLAGQFKLYLKQIAGGEFRLALFLAVLPAVFTYVITNQILYALGVWFIGVFLIYPQIREQVRVYDVLAGRNFSCRSVVDLMILEEEIAKVANCFRHLLEVMKNWEGREIIELKPYSEPIQQVIEKSHANP
jgi:hypothetical protein